MIVVTAPTGKIAGQLLPHLLANNKKVRVISRDAARLPDAVRDHVEIVEGSHSDAATVDRAFAGADSVFWLIPPQPHTSTLEAAYSDFSRPASESLRRHGVKHVVVVSALGRTTPWAEHAGVVTETFRMCDLIATSGAHVRSLALPGFMDNMLEQVHALQGERAFFHPLPGDAPYPTCSTGDIAVVAARLLLDTSWVGVADQPVLGPEDLSYNAMATILTDVLGMPIQFKQVPVDVYRAQLLGYGLSEAFVTGLVQMFEAKAEGLDNAAMRNAESTTPTSFRQWSAQYLKPAFVT